MEGKIPTGLFVPIQIPTPLDVAISYFQHPYACMTEMVILTPLHVTEKVIPTPLCVTETMIQIYCDSNTLMFAEMPVSNTSLILQIPDSDRLVRT